MEKWGRQGLTFLVFLLLARFLTPEDLGVVAAAMIVISLCEMLTLQGFPTAIVRLPRVEKEHVDSVGILSLATAGMLVAGVLLLAPQAASAIDAPGSVNVLRVLAAMIPLTAITVVPIALLTREMKFAPLAARTLASTCAGGAVGVAMAWAGMGVWSLVGMHVVSSVTGAVFLLASISWRPGLRFSIAHMRDVLPVSLSLLGSSMLYFVYTRADQAILGAALGPAALGYYALAGRATQLLREAVVFPLSSVAMPALASVQKDEARLMRVYYSLTGAGALVALPLCVGLGLTAHLVVPVVFGAKWDPAVPVVQVLCITCALNLIFVGTHPLAVTRNKAHLLLGINILHASLAVLGSWIGSSWGIEGVAYGVLVAWCCAAVAGLFILTQKLGVSLRRFGESLALPTAACMVMALGVAALLSMLTGGALPAWLQLASAIVSGGLLYVGVVMACTPEPMESLRKSLRMFSRAGAGV